MLLEAPESHGQSEVCESCRRKVVATPAGSVAADALDVLAIAGMSGASTAGAGARGRRAGVALAGVVVRAVVAGVAICAAIPIGLPHLLALDIDETTGGISGIVRCATRFLIASLCGESFDKWPGR